MTNRQFNCVKTLLVKKSSKIDLLSNYQKFKKFLRFLNGEI